MPSKRSLQQSLDHQDPVHLPLDFGSTAVTGIHALVVEKLRRHFGLEEKAVTVHEPYQMLGLVEDDLQEALGVDVTGIYGPGNMFGHRMEGWKEWKTPWDQVVLVPGDFMVKKDEQGDILMYPEGDLGVAPSAKMPKAAYFFDALNRQGVIDDKQLNPEDNLEEFGLWTDAERAHWKKEAARVKDSGLGVVASFGGTAIGDIALVPAMNLKNPKGIRDVSDWYMSTLMRPDYLHQVFEKQTDIALQNLAMAWEATGDVVDVVFICGTDFGTQDSTFCDLETYTELYAPYYRKMNDWIHQNTSWKTFKHSCGAVESFMQAFIDSGFDIINPVQVNAAGMDPLLLKEKYGDRLTFWGGGVDTQKVLPFGSPEEVSEHVSRQIEIFRPGGGFVFNSVHNIQANVPLENVLAMWETFRQFR